MIIGKSLDKYGNRHWAVSTGPSVEPVSVDELKTFARIDGTSEDYLLNRFIEATRGAMEFYLGRSLIEQTITLKMDWWPGEVIKLPRPPLISITQVVTLDEDDAETSYASSNYYAITEAEPGLLCLKQGVTWPENTDRDHGGYEIQYKAGYGTGSQDVPELIRQGILMWATQYYENRILTPDPPPEVKLLLDNTYKMPRI